MQKTSVLPAFLGGNGENKSPTSERAPATKVGTEEWRSVVGWEGRYEVSSLGRVRKAGGALIGQWQKLRGYGLVRLARPRAMQFVHRLVAKAFIPNPANKPCVNHIDNDPTNNAVTNLEWCTQRENLAHASRQGRMAKFWAGKRSPNAQLDNNAVRTIRAAYAGGGASLEKLGVQFGISKRAVGRLINRETYADV